MWPTLYEWHKTQGNTKGILSTKNRFWKCIMIESPQTIKQDDGRKRNTSLWTLQEFMKKKNWFVGESMSDRREI